MALTDQILAAYTFDAGSLADFFASGPTLVNEGGKSIAFTTDAKIGGAFAFGTYKGSDGASRLQSLNDIFTLRKLVGDPITGKDFTVTGWVYNAAANWNTQVGILSNWANNALGPTQWLFWPVDATHLEFRINDAAGSEHHAQVAAPTVAAWHFFCLTYEASSGNFSLAIDDGTPGTANIGVLGVQFGLGYAEFGNRNNAGSTLNGALDALTFHQRVLTTGERTQLYNAGAGLQPPWVAPVADFHSDIQSGDATLTVAFTDDSTNGPTSWAWTFGDSGTSTSQNPSHNYTTSGVYTVVLTSTNAFGSDVKTRTSYITVTQPAPVAAFSGTPLSGVRGTVVIFTDSSSNTPTSWLWNFGDGLTSAEQNPKHAYGDGTFTVTLGASNAGGSDSEVKSNYVGPITAPASTEDDDFVHSDFRR